MFEQTFTEKIDFSKSEQYTLSIRLSADGFSFSIYNPIYSSSFGFLQVAIKPTLSLMVNLREVISNLKFLSYSYKRVNILLVSKRFTLIPSDLFEEDQVEQIFYQNHSKQDNEVILHSESKRSGSIVSFSFDKSAHQLLLDHFPKVNFYSQACPLIDYFSGKCRLGNSRKMYAYITEERLDLFCFDRGKLLLVNSFECEQTTDRVYYLLYVWKQLGFCQERDELHLAGVICDKEVLVSELKRYVKLLFIINQKAEFSAMGENKMEDIPFDLQTLTLCGVSTFKTGN